MKEFKEVAHYYLGTGLKVSVNLWSRKYGKYINDDMELSIETYNDDLKPYLRSLNQLTKEIEVDGEVMIFETKFVNRVLSLHYTELKFWEIRLLIKHHFNVFEIKDFIELK